MAYTGYGPKNWVDMSPEEQKKVLEDRLNMEAISQPEIPRVRSAFDFMAMRPVVKGSGEKDSLAQTQKQESKLDHQSTTKMGQLRDPSISGQFLKQLEEAIPSFMEQRDLQRKYGDLLALSESRPIRPNLAGPMMNFAERMAGRAPNPAWSQQPTMSSKDFLANYDKMVDDKKDYNKLLVAAMNASKSGTVEDMFRQGSLFSNAFSQAKSFTDPNMVRGTNQIPVDIRIRDMARKIVDRDNILKKMPEEVQGLVEARDMLNGNSPVEASNFRFALLKALGVGRITNYELQGEQGSKALVDWFNQRLSTLKEGTLTPKNQQEYLNMLDKLLEASSRVYHHRKDFVINHITQNYGVPEENARFMVDENLFDVVGKSPKQTQQKASPAAPAAPAVGGGDPGMDAFLRSRGKK